LVSITALMLLGIIAVNLEQFSILFRDFALALAAISLAVLGTIDPIATDQ